MIKIDKDTNPPEVKYTNEPHKGLNTWLVAEEQVLRDYNNDPIQFNNGKYRFPVLYKYEEYRNALEKKQGPKCCYCEKPLEGGDIEHFRPKAAWQQSVGASLHRPGYYWLAYRWENMLIACKDCNMSGRKGNLFPVNGFRATTHQLNYKTEDNVLINPAEEDPALYISFNGHQPMGIDAGGRGNKNIEIYNLINRADIKSIREDRYSLYEINNVIANIPSQNSLFTQKRIDEAKNYIKEAQNNKAPFAGMIRANFPQLPINKK